VFGILLAFSFLPNKDVGRLSWWDLPMIERDHLARAMLLVPLLQRIHYIIYARSEVMAAAF